MAAESIAERELVALFRSTSDTIIIVLVVKRFAFVPLLNLD